MITLSRELKEHLSLVLTKIGADAIARMSNELISQGHRATGRSIKSLKPTVYLDGTDLVLEIRGAGHLRYVDSGVRASRVRYPKQVIIDWMKTVRIGRNAKERESIFWAIRNAHKKEGIPTKSSYRFSKNGRRKGWIKHSMKELKVLDYFENDKIKEKIKVYIYKSIAL